MTCSILLLEATRKRKETLLVYLNVNSCSHLYGKIVKLVKYKLREFSMQRNPNTYVHTAGELDNLEKVEIYNCELFFEGQLKEILLPSHVQSECSTGMDGDERKESKDFDRPSLVTQNRDKVFYSMLIYILPYYHMQFTCLPFFFIWFAYTIIHLFILRTLYAVLVWVNYIKLYSVPGLFYNNIDFLLVSP